MDRFWAKVDRDPAELAPGACWLWLGSREKRGYGRIIVGRSVKKAHRIGYELSVGAILDGLEVDHVCGNTSCVNPSHLDPVVHAENVRRGRLGETNRARGMARTHCRNGHPFDETNTARNSSNGRRFCRTCCNDAQRRRWAERRQTRTEGGGAPCIGEP